MRRFGWTFVPLVLLAGACVPDVDITHDANLSGHVTAKTFRVRPGVVVSVSDDLIVDSRGPAIIEGDLRGQIGSGASIEIHVSSGDVLVSGGLTAGSGADGDEPGENGDAGGGVRLRADLGAILLRGPLAAGDGGEGSGKLEQGRGDVRVVSGAGGPGGDVELNAAAVELGAGAAAGDGGAGGASFAQVFALAPGEPNIVDSGESLADEEEDGLDEEPRPDAGSAHALSSPGGSGGSIRIQAAGLRIEGGPVLRAGFGGATSRASARGGNAASVELAKPGAGGNVLLPASFLPQASAGLTLIPGAGGDAGLLGAISAAAYAHTAAGVKTAGGGDGGKAFVGLTAVKLGAGGDSCNVLAQTEQEAKYDFGSVGAEGAPGKPASVQSP